jgi:hypothetical protein
VPTWPTRDGAEGAALAVTHAATLLPSGKVIAAGGEFAGGRRGRSRREA